MDPGDVRRSSSACTAETCTKKGNGSDPANTAKFQSFCWVDEILCNVKALRTQHHFPNELIINEEDSASEESD